MTKWRTIAETFRNGLVARKRHAGTVLWAVVLVALALILEGEHPARAAEGTALPMEPVTITRPKEGSLTFLRHLTISGHAPNQALLTLRINDVTVGVGVAGQKTPGEFEFVNVPVSPGPQRITVAATSQGITQEATVTIHVQGPPAKLDLLGPDKVPADPTQTVTYQVKVTDSWGQPVPEGLFVTLSAEGLLLETPDADPNTAGVQVRPVGGVADVKIRSPHAASIGHLVAATGNLTALKRIRFFLAPRPLMVVGRFSAAFGQGYHSSPAGPPSEPGPGLSNDGRVRIFLRGSTENGYLVTSAFDSRRDLEDRLFKELDPDRMLPVFGDTSSVFYEAQSRDRFYFQVEKEDNLYRYGDFLTDIAPNSLGAYQRALTGVRLQQSTAVGPLTFFGAMTRQSSERAEIRGNGTSGYYFLPRAPVVPGSERIWIEVRDRDRPHVILQSEYRLRFLDYDIDYQQGSLFFRQPVPGIDAQQNPVYIVAIYESEAPGPRRILGGVRSDVRFGDVQVGSTFVREERTGRDYLLGSLDASLKLPLGIVLTTEVASTRAEESGSAWRAELQAAPTAGTRVRAFVRSASRDFENPSVPQFQIGTRQRGLDVTHDISPKASALIQYYRQSGADTVLTTANGRYRHAFSKGKAEVELLHQQFSGTAMPSASRSTLLSALASYPLRGNLEVLLQREQSISGENPLRPDGTTLGADYQVAPRVKLLAREKLTDEGKSIASIGISSEVLKGTSLTSTYELNSVNSGGYNQASIGLNTVLSLTRFLTSHIAYESVHIFGDTPGYWSASIGLEYKPKQPFIGALKLERRRSGGWTQRSLTLNGSGRLARDLAVLVRHTDFSNRMTSTLPTSAVGVPSGRTAVALAYRPGHDRLNVLARYQVRKDSSGLLAGATPVNQRVDIAAMEGIYQPTARWQLIGKHAFRRSSVTSDGVRSRALTDLWLGRITYDLSDQWNVSAEYRRLHQHETHSHEQGCSLELGHVLRPDLMVGLGYNFSGEDDPDLSGGARWARGPYVRLGLLLDENDVRSWLTDDSYIRTPKWQPKPAQVIPEDPWVSHLGHPPFPLTPPPAPIALRHRLGLGGAR